jgi:hypothetical protein
MTDVMTPPSESLPEPDPDEKRVQVTFDNAIDDYEDFVTKRKPYFLYFFVLSDSAHEEAHAAFCDEIWLDTIPGKSGVYITGEEVELYGKVISTYSGSDSDMTPDVIAYYAGAMPESAQILLGISQPITEA